MQIELTSQGYLHINAKIARRYFPEDVLVALLKNSELWLLPIHSAHSGGLLMKQRNRQGDRSVLILESLPADIQAGSFAAFWDEQNAALRINLNARA